MRLWRFEVKKLLLTQRGLALLLVCLLLKAGFLLVFPELKDARIALSQKQYDAYLTVLHGPNTPEKAAYILGEYEHCRQTIDSREAMEAGRRAGTLTEGEWLAYTEALEGAYLRRNAAKLFAEKAEQFAAQSPALPPAHYLYEYGWHTVFTLLRFPDGFLLFGLLLLAAQCLTAETAGGMLPLLLAARDGRGRLFGAKLLALLAVGLAAALLSCSLEAAIFRLRGWCNDSAAPLYSLTLFADGAAPLSLGRGYLRCLWVRVAAALLLAGLVFAASVWLKTPVEALALALLAAPILFGGPGQLFTPAGLLRGTLLLQSGLPPLLPLTVVGGCSAALLLLASARYKKGL